MKDHTRADDHAAELMAQSGYGRTHLDRILDKVADPGVVYTLAEMHKRIERFCRIDSRDHAARDAILYALLDLGGLTCDPTLGGKWRLGPVKVVRNPNAPTARARRDSETYEAVVDEWGQVMMVRQGPEAEAVKARIRKALHDRRKQELLRQLADLDADAEPVAA